MSSCLAQCLAHVSHSINGGVYIPPTPAFSLLPSNFLSSCKEPQSLLILDSSPSFSPTLALGSRESTFYLQGLASSGHFIPHVASCVSGFFHLSVMFS